MDRRRFLQSSAVAGTSLALAPFAAADSNSVDSRIEVFVDVDVATIAPEVYGHFAEHIGGLVYDGIWVGKGSGIPNLNGIRKELVDHMRRLQPGSLRWPGGCFADSYDWKDGIGPVKNRLRRANFWINTPFMRKAPDGPSKYEPNHFGTDEFLQFCELIDTKPYLAVNARTRTVRDFVDWVEYCNAPAGWTTMSDQRQSNGHAAPYNVAYWGIGNESWGCGGDMRPEDYATAFRQFTSFVPSFDVDPKLVAVGPSDSWNKQDVDWTERLFDRLAGKSSGSASVLRRVDGYSLHFYCGTAGKSSIDYTDDDWYELIWRSDRMETIIDRHWEVLAEFDPNHRIKLFVDEWGAWHAQETEVHNTHLFGQTSTMRDALIAALTLDTFNRHADKVAMGNIAQLINNLQSLFLANGDRFVVTPNFYVFEMYKQHQGGRSVRTAFTAPTIEEPRRLWGLAGSASRKGNRVFVTAVNPSLTDTRKVEIVVAGGQVKNASAQAFAQDDVRTHNDLEHPNSVKPPQAIDVAEQGGAVVCTFPPASVNAVELEL